MMFRKFPFVPQHDTMDCGPACIAMISKYYGKSYGLQYLRENSFLTKDGVSLLGLTSVAEQIGFESFALKLTIDELISKEAYPSVLFWDACHFVVLYKVKKSLLSGGEYFYISDPAEGQLRLSRPQFTKYWLDNEGKGIVFVAKPGDNFKSIPAINRRTSISSFFVRFIRPYRDLVIKLFITIACGSILTLVFPFLSQVLIDEGVSVKSHNIVKLVIIAQVALYIGSVIIEIARNWIVLYMGTFINVSIISRFFKKVLKLPISFFETKFLGDFYQRIQDHSRIEEFLTSQSMTTIFSIITFIVFMYALLNYSLSILAAYAGMTSISICWTLYYMKQRAYIDYFKFRTNAMSQDAISEIIYGIQDIKLNNLEDDKIERWSKIQRELLKVNIKSLKVEQIQSVGFNSINQLKNFIVSYIAASAVIDGDMTVGGLVSISYIIGQLNSPINQLTQFFKSFQDASLSIERLTEIQELEDEDSIVNPAPPSVEIVPGIVIQNVVYQYEGPHSPLVLNGISFTIPKGKTTAIVGSSGSGKSTLIKLLLKFYPTTEGHIYIDGNDIASITPTEWRQQVGAVLQDGYIFSDTIKHNITCNSKAINNEVLQEAIDAANINDYINGLPQGVNTVIGAMGSGMSGGQKQRLLIARAIYKQPEYIFLDEATSALDSKNEQAIQGNLASFFKGRTVVIVAHRLSTVKNADQIVVLENGTVAEIGTHQSLLQEQGVYYNLVRTQLEMDIDL